MVVIFHFHNKNIYLFPCFYLYNIGNIISSLKSLTSFNLSYQHCENAVFNYGKSYLVHIKFIHFILQLNCKKVTNPLFYLTSIYTFLSHHSHRDIHANRSEDILLAISIIFNPPFLISCIIILRLILFFSEFHEKQNNSLFNI